MESNEWVLRNRERKARRRMKKKGRIKKQKEYKTQNERLEWAKRFKSDLDIRYGLHPGCSGSGAIIDLFSIIDKYVENGENVSGKIDFFDAPFGGRIIHYILTNTKGIENTITMLLKDRSLIRNK